MRLEDVLPPRAVERLLAPHVRSHQLLRLVDFLLRRASASVMARGAGGPPRAATAPLTRLLKIRVPIMCAGMGGTTGPDLVAAVSNAATSR